MRAIVTLFSARQKAAVAGLGVTAVIIEGERNGFAQLTFVPVFPCSYTRAR